MLKKLMITTLILVFTGLGSGQAALLYDFSVDREPAEQILPLTGFEDAKGHYNHAWFSAAPGHGFAKNDTAFFWLYEQKETGHLSLSVLFDKKGGRPNMGRADFKLSGMPSGWEWTLRDDWTDWLLTPDDRPSWIWLPKQTDGGVMGNLESKQWDISWELTRQSGLENWYFLTQDENKIRALPFDLSPGSTLTVSSHWMNAPSHAVPAPSALVLLGCGLIGFAGLARRCAAPAPQRVRHPNQK